MAQERARSALRRFLPSWRQPARIVVLAFASVIAIGTVLLMLPAASARGESTGFVDALFTATSETVVHAGDILVVAGRRDQVEEFADLT